MAESVADFASNSPSMSPVQDTVQVENDETCIPNENSKGLKTPYVGMLFDTMEEARNYYQDYGRQKGFWIRTRSSSETRSRSDDITSRQFVCVHQGKHVSRNIVHETLEENEDRETCETENMKKMNKNCSTVKCGCKASMRIVHDRWSNKWKISVFKDVHNHKPVTPERRMKMKSNKVMPKAARVLTETFHEENLPIAKVSSIFGGTHIGFNKRDCYNHLRNVRHRQLDGGDAQSVLTYFRKKQAENPHFFYAIQCDENGRATNFFWVDARSRMAYQYFGDVVTFDTTYRTNKYDMPFAPFTGVNHHWQSIQFGCALLQDETEVTFLWLFETWLEAMGGRHPITIITNQDLAMKGAIAKVFPNTHHRLCLWHIKKKFAEKLSHVYFKKSKFKIEMKKCTRKTYKIDDFEVKWKALMKEYGLENDEWLKSLYEMRSSWVPVYNRRIFFAGMNTTGRSEGINSFFDGFVTPTTNLREFVVKYEQALKKIMERQSDEDFESEHKYRIVNEGEFLLQHAASLYTRNVFNKFKDEWSKVNRYKVEEMPHDNEDHAYVVKSKLGEQEEFVVKLNAQTHKGTCECQNFEFVGILCRHLLKVFVRLDVDTIPEHFILPRWKQEANKFRIMDFKSLVTNDGKEESEALRLSHMCHQATKLACTAASSNEAYTIFMEAIDELSKKLSEYSCQDTTIASSTKGDTCTNIDSSVPVLLDPYISQTKGRKKDNISSSKRRLAENSCQDENVASSTKGDSLLLLLDPNISQTGKKKDNISSSKRMKSGIELAQQKKKRKCRSCNKLVRHDTRNCPSNPKRRKIESTNEWNEEQEDLGEYVESDDQEYLESDDV
ncbi:protein FAR1-RELATED SEQUENCE 5-like [Malus sylvestris]|uniref:protein FAR1-RELATED SEQUENCE 5-like n=1 Tax=Malus sylvestris TaxID=3752 RepID=UPI0021ABE758|nr:protein FAR1-RELATED SEQUENCE 5-like [Malus sylvestris]